MKVSLNKGDISLAVDSKTGVVESIVAFPVGKQELISPWSVEFGDPKSFFSLEKHGWGNVRSNFVSELHPSVNNPDSMEGSMQIEASTGKINLEWQDEFSQNQINRRAQLEAIDSVLLMDFVIQYRFKASAFPVAEINSRKYSHKNRNLYIQHPVDKVMLYGKSVNNSKPYTAEIICTDANTADGKFRQEMYIRDLGEDWIVHIRLMPQISDLETIKLNVPWYNKAINQGWADYLLKQKWIKDLLWYRGELKGYPLWNPILRILKPSAYRFTKLAAGSSLSIDSLVKFNFPSRTKK